MRGKERKGRGEERNKMIKNKGGPCDRSKALLAYRLFFSHLPTHFKFQGLGFIWVELKGILHEKKIQKCQFRLQSRLRFVNEHY
jgi:hypothetical protein